MWVMLPVTAVISRHSALGRMAARLSSPAAAGLRIRAYPLRGQEVNPSILLLGAPEAGRRRVRDEQGVGSTQGPSGLRRCPRRQRWARARRIVLHGHQRDGRLHRLRRLRLRWRHRGNRLLEAGEVARMLRRLLLAPLRALRWVYAPHIRPAGAQRGRGTRDGGRARSRHDALDAARRARPAPARAASARPLNGQLQIAGAPGPSV